VGLVDRVEGPEPPPPRLKIDQLRTRDALRNLCASLLITGGIRDGDPIGDGERDIRFGEFGTQMD